MPQSKQTQVAPMQVKHRLLLQPSSTEASSIKWSSVPKKHRGESLMKNMAVASALVLCAVTLRMGAIPPLSQATDAILTAATDNSLLDDQLGKLSFVSTLFPEAVLVFGERNVDALSAPVTDGTIVHAWSEAEPYTTWKTDETLVAASHDGEVIGIYHGNGDERLVQVMSDNGISCLYGNLDDVHVQIGDEVHAGAILGSLLQGKECVFEIRQDGISLDPACFFAK